MKAKEASAEVENGGFILGLCHSDPETVDVENVESSKRNLGARAFAFYLPEFAAIRLTVS